MEDKAVFIELVEVVIKKSSSRKSLACGPFSVDVDEPDFRLISPVRERVNGTYPADIGVG